MASILALMPSAHAGAIIIDHNPTIPDNSTSDTSMCGDVDGTSVVDAHLLLDHVFDPDAHPLSAQIRLKTSLISFYKCNFVKMIEGFK